MATALLDLNDLQASSEDLEREHGKKVISCYIEGIMADDRVDVFTASDRNTLITTGVQLAALSREFERLRTSIDAHDSPSKEDFALLVGKVSSLENWKWWLTGIGFAGGLLGHALLGRLGF